MAIYAIGANFSGDVSEWHIQNSVIGTGWSEDDAPDLFEMIREMSVGDIVYIKSKPISGNQLHVKAVGIINDSIVIETGDIMCGRNVTWLATPDEWIDIPSGKNNVRLNTCYREYHPEVSKKIISYIVPVTK